jgi:hypothetical protein
MVPSTSPAAMSGLLGWNAISSGWSEQSIGSSLRAAMLDCIV